MVGDAVGGPVSTADIDALLKSALQPEAPILEGARSSSSPVAPTLTQPSIQVHTPQAIPSFIQEDDQPITESHAQQEDPDATQALVADNSTLNADAVMQTQPTVASRRGRPPKQDDKLDSSSVRSQSNTNTRSGEGRASGKLPTEVDKSKGRKRK